VVEGFRLLANELHPPLNDLLRNLDRVRRDPEELSGLPDRFAVFLEARVQWLGPVHPPNDGSAKFHSMFVYVPREWIRAYVKLISTMLPIGCSRSLVFQAVHRNQPVPDTHYDGPQRVIEAATGTWFDLPTVEASDLDPLPTEGICGLRV
jgi:hypothetical protein